MTNYDDEEGYDDEHEFPPPQGRSYNVKRLFVTRHGFWRAWTWVALILVSITSLIFSGWVLNYAVQRVSCEQKADAMGRKYDYGTWKGCLVQTDDGKMVPLGTFRLTHQENSK